MITNPSRIAISLFVKESCIALIITKFLICNEFQRVTDSQGILFAVIPAVITIERSKFIMIPYRYIAGRVIFTSNQGNWIPTI